MTATELTPELIEQVRKLSLRSREELFDMTEPEETDAAREAWRAELARRVESIRDGSVQLISYEDSLLALERMVDGELGK